MTAATIFLPLNWTDERLTATFTSLGQQAPSSQGRARGPKSSPPASGVKEGTSINRPNHRTGKLVIDYFLTDERSNPIVCRVLLPLARQGAARGSAHSIRQGIGVAASRMFSAR
jgi:hypothetical protein